METTVKMDEKLGGKTQKKFLHKLNKQQRVRWRHLTNRFELFTGKHFRKKVSLETVLKKLGNFEEKTHRNTPIS